LLRHSTTDWADRKSAFKNGSVAITSYIVSKFVELPYNNLGVYAVKTRNFAVIRPQFDDDLHSSLWCFETD